MNVAILGLTVAYWFHMLATIFWIGGLAALTLIVLPAASRVLDMAAYAEFLAAIQKRLDPLGWFSVIVLLASGMFQMSANPNYEGFLSLGSLWAGSIFIKHLLFALMVLISAVITWGLLPAIRRAALVQASGRDAENLQNLRNRERFLLGLNLILGILILLFTAVARSA